MEVQVRRNRVDLRRRPHEFILFTVERFVYRKRIELDRVGVEQFQAQIQRTALESPDVLHRDRAGDRRADLPF